MPEPPNPPPPPPRRPLDHPPHAEVCRRGRWTWEITIHQGVSRYSFDVHGSRERADRKARLELEHIKRDPCSERFEVRG